MHPLHAHLHAMDGSRAYLTRLAELPEEYREMLTPQGRASVRAIYRQVLANYRAAYPGYPLPDVPLCMRHR